MAELTTVTIQKDLTGYHLRIQDAKDRLRSLPATVRTKSVIIKVLTLTRYALIAALILEKARLVLIAEPEV